MSYEQARDELVTVVARLEAGGETLEGSLALWERGEQLAARCQEWLDGARARLDAARADVPEIGPEGGADDGPEGGADDGPEGGSGDGPEGGSGDGPEGGADAGADEAPVATAKGGSAASAGGDSTAGAEGGSAASAGGDSTAGAEGGSDAGSVSGSAGRPTPRTTDAE
jgi:exodeoxyribonuclease VII small subunit